MNQLLERMVGELTELKRKKLLSTEEVRQIVATRRTHEYSVRRVNTSAAEYLRYIDYERKLHLLINKRVDRLSLQRFSGEIRSAGLRRISSLFERLTRRFPADLDLWFGYLDFCRHHYLDAQLSSVFGRALQRHPLSEELWSQAAKWEFTRNNNMQAARSLFQRGIRAAPKSSKLLWLGFFQLELKYLDKIRKRVQLVSEDGQLLDQIIAETASSSSSSASPSHIRLPGEDDDPDDDSEEEDVPDVVRQKSVTITNFSLGSPFLSGAIPRAIYSAAVQEIPNDLQFRVDFITAARKYTGTSELREEMFVAIARDFPTDDKAWSIYCRRAVTEAAPSTLEQAQILAGKEYRRVLVDEGLCTTASLWLEYVDFLLDALRTSSASSPHHRSVLQWLFHAYHLLLTDSSSSPLVVVSPALWQRWVHTLLHLGLVQQAQQLCERLLHEHPTDVQILSFALRVVVHTNRPIIAEALAKIRTSFVKTESSAAESEERSTLLALYFRTFASLQTPLSIRKLYREALDLLPSFPPRTFASVKALLLQQALSATFASHHKEQQQIRQFYQGLLQYKPNPLAFFLDCISFERSVSFIVDETFRQEALVKIRELFNQAAEEHGAVACDLWLDFVRFELELQSPQRANDVYRRAKRTLADPSTFVIEYARFNSAE